MVWMFVVLIGVVVVAGLLLLMAKALGADETGPTDSESLPFQKRDWLLTKAERSFFGVLEAALAGELAGYRVMCKVRLADLVWLPRGVDASTRARLQNQVNAKHVDFVIVTADELRPVAVVEHDDASHGRADRQKRDALVDRVLAGAGIGVVRFAARRGYVARDVARAVEGVMS